MRVSIQRQVRLCRAGCWALWGASLAGVTAMVVVPMSAPAHRMILAAIVLLVAAALAATVAMIMISVRGALISLSVQHQQREAVIQPLERRLRVLS